MKLNNITDKTLNSILKAIEKFKTESYLNNFNSVTTTWKDEDASWPWPTGYPESKSITQTATEQGIKFIHVQHLERRCTIAYRPVKHNGNMLDIAVAYVHPKDQFNKKIGAMTAASRFMSGRYVTMPLRNKDNYVTYNNIVDAFAGRI